MTGSGPESFEEFKDSFSYGTRSDLSFKFLRSLSPDEGAEFLREILGEVGETFDSGSPDDLIDLVYRWQVTAYTPKPGTKRHYVYEDRPFRQLRKPLSETTLGLVTSSGHFMADDPPGDGRADLNQAGTTSMIEDFLRRAPELSEIDTAATPDALRVLHPGYDVRSAEKDSEVTLPLGALRRAVGDGRVGGLAGRAFSFVGACSQGRLRNELNDWISRWKSAGIEALFLVPV